jgi:hypothetical protein
MRPKIHAWMVATVALVLPLQVQAQTAPQDAPKWCPVSPADGASELPSLVHELQGKLDSQPSPMDHVHTEGTLPHKGIRDESIMAERDWPVMRDAALAWRAGAGDAYLKLATRYFTGWVNVYKPDLNPIDETNLDDLIDTYAIIAPTLKPDDRAAAQAYIRNWAKAYIDSIDSHRIVSPSPQATTWNNNWQSHRIKLVTMMAVALNDDELFHAARRLFQTQIEANMHGDGEVIDFEERDAMHYVIYDLEPLAQAALAARVHGEDWYNYQAPNGASLAKGFAWLYPYANGDKPHEEFLHSKVLFDAQRAAAGEKGYSGPFDVSTAGNVMWLGAAFDAKYLPVAQKLHPKPPAWLAMCGV